MPIASKSLQPRVRSRPATARTSTWSAMPSLPATISCRMPSMSSSGSATMVQALEKAVWPVRPISQESTSVTRVPGGPLRLARQRGQQAAGAARRSPARRCRSARRRACGHRRHHGRGRFFTDGCTSTMCSGQKISQLKQVMQCSRNLITGRSLVWRRPATSLADRLRLHVDDVGRADHVADAAAGAFLDLDALDHAAS